MRNHTLMQTIARANRVSEGKEAGLIVDYVGIFRSLQKALAIYARPDTGGDTPILDKQKLVEFLKNALKEASEFCTKLGVNLESIQNTDDAFQKVKQLGDAVDALIISEESKKTFLNMASKIARVFKAIKPDPICVDVRMKQAKWKETVMQRQALNVRSRARMALWLYLSSPGRGMYRL